MIHGEPGHQRHEGPSFPAGMTDENLPNTLAGCPDCGGELLISRQAESRVIQPAYGKRVRDALRELFAVIHRRDTLSPDYSRILARRFRSRRNVLFCEDRKPNVSGIAQDPLSPKQ